MCIVTLTSHKLCLVYYRLTLRHSSSGSKVLIKPCIGCLEQSSTYSKSLIDMAVFKWRLKIELFHGAFYK